MVVQYPYTLYAKNAPESYQNDDGDWVIGESEFIEIGKCRDEVNGSGALVTSQDGQKHHYSWLIYAPLKFPKLSPGTEIKVLDDSNDERMTGKVLRCSKDQFHVRIWV